MSDLSRRGFMGAGAAVAGAVAVGAVATGADAQPRPVEPAAVAKPSAKPATKPAAKPAAKPKLHGDIRDIKHVVILMQENRSFDHYYGAMKGVRGFGDRSTITLPGGFSVFNQPTTLPGTPSPARQYPWALSAAPPSAYPAGHQPPNSEVGAQGYNGTSHGWDDQHGAWWGGWMNGWYFSKGGPTTLGYLSRNDLPYHYALADAYTIGDAYHCSVMSATGPNRTYLWSGTIDAQQKYSDFVAYSGGDELGRFLLWQCYAVTLQNAGISWHNYQCADDYGDAGTEYFNDFAQLDPTQGGKADPGNPLYDHGVANVPEPLTGLSANADNLADAIKADVLAGTLPQVSWVITNQAFSEHPDGAPNDGAYYVNAVLQALNADPDVFNSTLVIYDYDENDGQFDHVPPPVPAPGEVDEFYRETGGALAALGVTEPLPVGLGFRVPLMLISPWTRGGWVTSEVSDHTSVIQFLEKWTTAIGKPAISPNISAWRRRVCGDLTDAFDFKAPVYGLPSLPAVTVIGDPPGGAYVPPPTTNQMPVQEPGVKRARPLPYQPNANLTGFTFGTNGSVVADLELTNNGPLARKASHFAVYNNVTADQTIADYPGKFPGQYTVDASRTSGVKALAAPTEIGAGHGEGVYDLTITGPNRFLRRFTGDVSASGRAAQVTASYFPGGFGPHPKLMLEFSNGGPATVVFTVTTNYYTTARPATVRVHVGDTAGFELDPLATSRGWYDITVTLSGDASWSRRFVGHLENGQNSITGS